MTAILADVDALLTYIRSERPSRKVVTREVRALRERVQAADLDEPLKLQAVEMLDALSRTLTAIETAPPQELWAMIERARKPTH